MRVLGSGVDLELLHLSAPKTVFGDHSFDGPLNDVFRATLADLGRGLDGLTTDVARVTGVNFVILFISRETNVSGIDHDDEVTGVNVRCEDGFVLSAKKACGFHGDFAEDLVFSVDDVPLALDVGWFGRERFHFLENTPSIQGSITERTEGAGKLWRSLRGVNANIKNPRLVIRALWRQ